MAHHDLIKKLRKERFLTQKQLAQGIGSPNSLASFEQHGSQLSLDRAVRYLERLNVSLEEYEFMLADAEPTAKRQFATQVRQSFKQPFSPELFESLHDLFLETNDFFYYSLLAQYFLVQTYIRHDGLVLMPKYARKRQRIEANVTKYLDSIDVWGRFELVLFTNCLFLFSDAYIRFHFVESVKQMQVFKDSAAYSTDLIKFLINGTQLSYERDAIENFQLFFHELKQLATLYGNTKAKMLIKLFTILINLQHGLRQEADIALMGQTLEFLGETDWLAFFNRHSQTREA